MPGYGVGALAVLAASIGAAIIVYGGGFILLDPLNLPAWLLGPLGAYTIIYSYTLRRDPVYYFIWGIIMLGIALASALYMVVNPAIIVGLVILVAVATGLAAYRRGGR